MNAESASDGVRTMEVITQDYLAECYLRQRFASTELTNVLQQLRNGAKVEEGCSGEMRYWLHEPTPDNPFEIVGAQREEAADPETPEE